MNIPLFHKEGELRNLFESQKHRIIREIEAYEKKLIDVKAEELTNYLIDKYSLQAPILHDEDKYIAREEEADVDVSGDPMRAVFDRSRPTYIKGISITIAVPFEGDPNLFYFSPSTFTYNPPRGDVVGQEIHLSYTKTEHNPDELNKEITRGINDIKKYLEWVNRDVGNFNSSLEPLIREAISKRKAKLQKDVDLVTRLGIPVKKRTGIPKTYTVPEIRKKARIAKPEPTEKLSKPEPILEMQEYENILDIIRQMAFVIEKSPKAFSTMEEEQLRDHFLVQLNGQYEGMATGETFNVSGKTDILIRYDGKNVFIAECKFWKGEKSLLEAIDQLLGYTSWRDTKTAILLFNRTKSFSSVLTKIPGTVKSHKCFQREVAITGETDFRYVFQQPQDPERELILTVLAFDVPSLEN